MACSLNFFSKTNWSLKVVSSVQDVVQLIISKGEKNTEMQMQKAAILSKNKPG